MGVLEIIGGAILIVASIFLILVVVSQESKQSGLSAMSGSTDSYMSKNRGKTMNAKLANLTKIIGIAFFVITLGLNIIIHYVK